MPLSDWLAIIGSLLLILNAVANWRKTKADQESQYAHAGKESVETLRMALTTEREESKTCKDELTEIKNERDVYYELTWTYYKQLTKAQVKPDRIPPGREPTTDRLRKLPNESR